MSSILIIDDERELLESLGELMEAIGITNVILTSSGEDGLSIFNEKSTSICAVFCDYNMPKFSGEKVYANIRQVSKVPFCLMSGGFIGDYPVFRGLSDSQDSFYFLPKPFDIDRLSETARNMGVLKP